MVNTEYKTISNTPSEFDQMLNTHVIEGWELVTFQAIPYPVNDGFPGLTLVALLRRDRFEDNGRITTLRRTHV